MSFEPDTDIDINAVLEDRKNIILSICSNFLENKLNELSVEESFSNTDILFLLDDLMTSLYGLIVNQAKQIKGEISASPKASSCISATVGDFKNKWDRELEKQANKIVRSQTNEKTLLQMFSQIEKSQKSLVSSLFFSIKRCLER